MTITDKFVGLLYVLEEGIISPNVYEQANLCLIDFIGVAAAGQKILGSKGKAFIESIKRQGGNSSIIGSSEKVTLHNAAFINSMSAHATELDDGHRLGMIHLGASIISGLLAVAEIEDIKRDNVVRGVIAGYEAAVRMSKSMQPSHKVRGYHTSGTCGTIGAAVAIAVAMKFDKRQLKSAISAATASASGLLEMQENSSELKPYNIAQAAVGGITAAYIAKAGFIGPDDAIGGRRGMMSVMSENAKVEVLVEPQDFMEIERIYRKPYAACRHCHPAIEGAITIKNEYGINAYDIKEIIVNTYKLAVGGHDHKEIEGVSSAKLSTPFSIALALTCGNAGIDDFNENTISDQTILSLAQKVNVLVDNEITSWSPQKRAARVTIKLNDGREYSHLVDNPKGEPENPMTREEIEKKYFELTKGVEINKFYKQYGL